MSRFSTLNYLINSYHTGKKEVELFQSEEMNFKSEMNFDHFGFEPSISSVQAILNFASQYEVLKSAKSGNIELNLN
ncbi:MAG: hypothetical protein WAO52_07935 [Prolixibacteraceae bacterium]